MVGNAGLMLPLPPMRMLPALQRVDHREHAEHVQHRVFDVVGIGAQGRARGGAGADARRRGGPVAPPIVMIKQLLLEQRRHKGRGGVRRLQAAEAEAEVEVEAGRLGTKHPVRVDEVRAQISAGRVRGRGGLIVITVIIVRPELRGLLELLEQGGRDPGRRRGRGGAGGSHDVLVRRGGRRGRHHPRQELVPAGEEHGGAHDRGRWRSLSVVPGGRGRGGRGFAGAGAAGISGSKEKKAVARRADRVFAKVVPGFCKFRVFLERPSVSVEGGVLMGR